MSSSSSLTGLGLFLEAALPPLAVVWVIFFGRPALGAAAAAFFAGALALVSRPRRVSNQNGVTSEGEKERWEGLNVQAPANSHQTHPESHQMPSLP